MEYFCILNIPKRPKFAFITPQIAAYERTQ